MKTADFNYELPKELIAQHPLEKRDLSRLMILDKKNKTIEHKYFKDIIEYLDKGDCLVINNTKVIPARLIGQRITENIGNKEVEILLLKETENKIWEAMVRPGKKIKQGTKIEFGEGILKAEVLEVLENR